MTSEIRSLAQHLLHAGVSPLSERIRRVARRATVARDLDQLVEDRGAAADGSSAFVEPSVPAWCASGRGDGEGSRPAPGPA